MKHLFALLAISLPILLTAQRGSNATTTTTTSAATPSTAVPFIDVTGTAEIEVEPDMFYVVFSLKQKTENKLPVTVSQQLDKIKYTIQSSGANIENFLLEEDGADYIKVLPVKKEDPAPQYFIMMLTEADVVKRTLKTIDSLGANDIRITEVGYSQEDTITQYLRTEAVKDAKATSDYMLAELGNSTGKALYIYEDGHDVYYFDGPQFREYADYTGETTTTEESGGMKPKITFGKAGIDTIEKIKYEYIVVIRFEIK